MFVAAGVGEGTCTVARGRLFPCLKMTISPIQTINAKVILCHMMKFLIGTTDWTRQLDFKKFDADLN
jgi:hypothetical protein